MQRLAEGGPTIKRCECVVGKALATTESILWIIGTQGPKAPVLSYGR